MQICKEWKDYELFTWGIHEVFIVHESCFFVWVEGLKSNFALIALIRGKYYLHKH
jgi:hypothetical protein